MKKIVALLLAMLMMLNLSFAMAEDTFEENLAAFLNTLNVENGDLLLNAEAAGQAINVRAGKDEAGVHAALEIAGNAMGEAMLTADTAYVSAMGQGLKVQYQTVQNFAQKIIESMMGSANLSMDQIQADFQMLASKLAGQLFPLMQALKTEEVENGVKYSVDAAVLAEALPGAIDSLLADEEKTLAKDLSLLRGHAQTGGWVDHGIDIVLHLVVVVVVEIDGALIGAITVLIDKDHAIGEREVLSPSHDGHHTR